MSGPTGDAPSRADGTGHGTLTWIVLRKTFRSSSFRTLSWMRLGRRVKECSNPKKGKKDFASLPISRMLRSR